MCLCGLGQVEGWWNWGRACRGGSVCYACSATKTYLPCPFLYQISFLWSLELPGILKRKFVVSVRAECKWRRRQNMAIHGNLQHSAHSKWVKISLETESIIFLKQFKKSWIVRICGWSGRYLVFGASFWLASQQSVCIVNAVVCQPFVLCSSEICKGGSRFLNCTIANII